VPLRRALRVRRAAVERVGVRAERADAPALTAQERHQHRIPRHPGEAACGQRRPPAQPGREPCDVATHVRRVARLVVARAPGDATHDDAAGVEGQAAGIEVGLVADLDRAQRARRQRGPDRARERQRPGRVVGGEVDADRDRRACHARDPRQPRQPAPAEAIADAERRRAGPAGTGVPPRLVAGVAADPQRRRRPLRGAERCEQRSQRPIGTRSAPGVLGDGRHLEREADERLRTGEPRASGLDRDRGGLRMVAAAYGRCHRRRGRRRECGGAGQQERPPHGHASIVRRSAHATVEVLLGDG